MVDYSVAPPKANFEHRHGDGLAESFRRVTATGVDSTSGWRGFLLSMLRTTDLVTVVASLALAHLVRFGLSDHLVARSDFEYYALGVLIGAIWIFCLAAVRSRDFRTLGVGLTEYGRVVRATFLTFGGVAIVSLVMNFDVARGYLAVAFPVGTVLLVLERFAWRSWLIAQRRDGRFSSGTLVVGRLAEARRVLELLGRNPNAGYRAVGVAYTEQVAGEGHRAAGGLPVLDYVNLVELIKEHGVTAVLVAGELPGGPDEMRQLGWLLENSGVELILASKLTDVAGPRIYVQPVDGLPLVHVDLPRYSGVQHLAKRVTDVVISTVALALFMLPMLVIAALVKLDSPGPILFRQQRIGVRGTSFTIYKFRSMAIDAEARKVALADLNEGSGLLFKIRLDPRITRVGRVIRRYSLDELPQLFNVLIGDMSAVGPRPPLPEEVSKYADRVMRRLLIKPGLTGLWQVSGRSRLSWDESVRLDLFYVENWSVVGDIMILLRTASAVLGRDGAY
jgi:exopolysaccharide biosynthesis polyprenyl glycosylphosphotransferase